MNPNLYLFTDERRDCAMPHGEQRKVTECLLAVISVITQEHNRSHLDQAVALSDLTDRAFLDLVECSFHPKLLDPAFWGFAMMIYPPGDIESIDRIAIRQAVEGILLFIVESTFTESELSTFFAGDKDKIVHFTDGCDMIKTAGFHFH